MTWLVWNMKRRSSTPLVEAGEESNDESPTTACSCRQNKRSASVSLLLLLLLGVIWRYTWLSCAAPATYSHHITITSYHITTYQWRAINHTISQSTVTGRRRRETVVRKRDMRVVYGYLGVYFRIESTQSHGMGLTTLSQVKSSLPKTSTIDYNWPAAIKSNNYSLLTLTRRASSRHPLTSLRSNRTRSQNTSS